MQKIDDIVVELWEESIAVGHGRREQRNGCQLRAANELGSLLKFCSMIAQIGMMVDIAFAMNSESE